MTPSYLAYTLMPPVAETARSYAANTCAAGASKTWEESSNG